MTSQIPKISRNCGKIKLQNFSILRYYSSTCATHWCLRYNKPFETAFDSLTITRKPSYRWQTRATRKPAKIAPIWRAYTTLSLTVLAYLHAFNCYCILNPRNPEKFTENSNLWSSRSSKVIDLGANRKPICDFLLVINSNFSRICYRFRDIHG